MILQVSNRQFIHHFSEDSLTACFIAKGKARWLLWQMEHVAELSWQRDDSPYLFLLCFKDEFVACPCSTALQNRQQMPSLPKRVVCASPAARRNCARTNNQIALKAGLQNLDCINLDDPQRGAKRYKCLTLCCHLVVVWICMPHIC